MQERDSGSRQEWDLGCREKKEKAIKWVHSGTRVLFHSKDNIMSKIRVPSF